MPKHKKLPEWVTKLASHVITPPTITIDSLTGVRTHGGNYKLAYVSEMSAWLLYVEGVATSEILLNFTVTNNARRTLTGIVGGSIAGYSIGNVALSQQPVANLASGKSVSGRVSFDPPKWPFQDYVITLMFREFVPGQFPFYVVRSTSIGVLYTFAFDL